MKNMGENAQNTLHGKFDEIYLTPCITTFFLQQIPLFLLQKAILKAL